MTSSTTTPAVSRSAVRVAPSEHDRPADLDQEGLDDAKGQPPDQEDGSVEDELRDALGLGLAGHGYTSQAIVTTWPAGA
jgi:hypothetical protein